MRGCGFRSSGIDLITVEARVVVASIDTYLKYSEAVGQVAPASRPQAELAQNVMAENAALRAELAATKSGAPPSSPAAKSGRAERAGGRGEPKRPVRGVRRLGDLGGLTRVTGPRRRSIAAGGTRCRVRDGSEARARRSAPRRAPICSRSRGRLSTGSPTTPAWTRRWSPSPTQRARISCSSPTVAFDRSARRLHRSGATTTRTR